MLDCWHAASRLVHGGSIRRHRSTSGTRISNMECHDILSGSPLQCVPLARSGKNCCFSYSGEVKLYLDNSFLNRLFDDPLISLNKVEGEVLLWVIDLIQQKKATLIHSPFVENENFTNPFPDRKSFVAGVMRLATEYQEIDENTEARAVTLMTEMRMDPVDALHLAAAEAAQVDYFITCDYAVIKRYQGDIRVVSPLSFIYDYNHDNKNHHE
jgi:predicted nucleic acid-binding protein